MEDVRRKWTARLMALASLLLVSLVLVACPAPEEGATGADPAAVETTPEVGDEGSELPQEGEEGEETSTP